MTPLRRECIKGVLNPFAGGVKKLKRLDILK